MCMGWLQYGRDTILMKKQRVSDSLQAIRRHNLVIATSARGSKQTLAERLNLHNSDISHLINGRRLFTDKIARDIEKALDMAAHCLDARSPFASFPSLSSTRIQGATTDLSAVEALRQTLATFESGSTVLDLMGVSALCEALIKILVQKSREGRLSDTVVMEMLNKAMLL